MSGGYCIPQHQVSLYAAEELFRLVTLLLSETGEPVTLSFLMMLSAYFQIGSLMELALA